MLLKTKITKLFKGEIRLETLYYYLQGNYRYYLYYNPKLKWLIRKSILAQIDYRIRVMNKECYNNGECVVCGCSTTALQMCNKSCEGLCYPPIQSKTNWKFFIGDPAKGININHLGKQYIFLWQHHKNSHVLLTPTVYKGTSGYARILKNNIIETPSISKTTQSEYY